LFPRKEEGKKKKKKKGNVPQLHPDPIRIMHRMS
jgi:hypothetical protein